MRDVVGAAPPGNGPRYLTYAAGQLLAMAVWASARVIFPEHANACSRFSSLSLTCALSGWVR